MQKTKAVKRPRVPEMSGEDALMRLNVFANGLNAGGFSDQSRWVRGFRTQLEQLLITEEVIRVA